MSKSKDAIKLGVHGCLILQYCLLTELGKDITEHPSFRKKEGGTIKIGHIAYILPKRPSNKPEFHWSIFFSSMYS